MPAPDTMALLVSVGLAAFLLYRYASRALLVLAPHKVLVEADTPADAMKLPAGLESAAAVVQALGFVPIGSHIEKAPLARPTVSYDYVHPQDRAFATLHL